MAPRYPILISNSPNWERGVDDCVILVKCRRVGSCITEWWRSKIRGIARSCVMLRRSWVGGGWRTYLASQHQAPLPARLPQLTQVPCQDIPKFCNRRRDPEYLRYLWSAHPPRLALASLPKLVQDWPMENWPLEEAATKRLPLWKGIEANCCK